MACLPVVIYKDTHIVGHLCTGYNIYGIYKPEYFAIETVSYFEFRHT